MIRQVSLGLIKKVAPHYTWDVSRLIYQGKPGDTIRLHIPEKFESKNNKGSKVQHTIIICCGVCNNRINSGRCNTMEMYIRTPGSVPPKHIIKRLQIVCKTCNLNNHQSKQLKLL